MRCRIYFIVEVKNHIRIVMLNMIKSVWRYAPSLTRSYGKHNKKYLYKDGVKKENIIYYPRPQPEEEPSITPAKMFRVERIKPVKGNPFWEKRILKDLGLDGKASDFTVVKNIPENNARLWKIKHLIKITPISFKYGEPKKSDVDYTYLKENGECIVAKELIKKDTIKASTEFREHPSRLEGETLRKDLRLKWINPW